LNRYNAPLSRWISGISGMRFVLFFLLIILGFAMNSFALDPENSLIMTLKDGKVVIELYPDKAPNHVVRIKELTREGFYNGIVFHRVMDDFMAQAGDPTGTGSGGSNKLNLKAEFNSVHHQRGVLSMARTADPNSANSQFFIMLAPSPHLDGQYTVFGKVVEGMQYVDNIRKGDYAQNGTVVNPDKIVKMEVMSDTTTIITKKSEKDEGLIKKTFVFLDKSYPF
jgi:peptidylprolyl isomerase